jgi:ketosteroid isomerase-like protein
MASATACEAVRKGSGLLAAALLFTPLQRASAEQLTSAALERWLAGYEQAWESRDAARAAELFTPDALYRETPFDEPKKGQTGVHQYWSSVTADQRNIDFKAEILGIDGQTGIAHWSATFTSASTGAPFELDGIFVLTFAEDGRCSELREWWHLRP